MKKLLIISPRFPLPLKFGDNRFLLNRIDNLSSSYEITLLSFANKKNLEHINELEKLFNLKVITVNFSILAIFSNFYKLFFTLTPLQCVLFNQKQFEVQIKELSKQNFDIVHFIGIRLSEFHKYFLCYKIIDFMDSLSLNFKQRIDIVNPIKKIIYFIEYKKLKAYELKIQSSFNQSFVIASQDAKFFPSSNIIPISIDTKKFKPKHREFSGRICFFGNLDYLPNRFALEWFYDLLLILKDDLKEIEFHIIGSKNPKILKKYRLLNYVRIYQNVDKIEDYICQCDIAIAPIFHATGMQNKILESLACGLPTILTTKCKSDLLIKDRKECLFSNTRNEFLESIKELFNNSALRKKLSKNGRKFVVDHYSQEVIKKKLLKIYAKQ